MTTFKRKLCGFVTDSSTGTLIDGKRRINKSYTAWRNMISRCYDTRNKDYKYYGDKGVLICDEWKRYSNFKSWFDLHYINGFQIDKDIKAEGNKIYSPNTCMFISPADNVRESTSRRDNTYLKNQTGENNHMFGVTGSDHPRSKSKEYYETKPTFRRHFKTICKRQGWIFEDFEEIFAEWYNKSNGDRQRMYVYKIGGLE